MGQSLDSYEKNGPEKVELSGEFFRDENSHNVLSISQFIKMYDDLRHKGLNHSISWRKTLNTIPLPLNQQILMLNWIKSKDVDFYVKQSSKKRKIIISSSVLKQLKQNFEE